MYSSLSSPTTARSSRRHWSGNMQPQSSMKRPRQQLPAGSLQHQHRHQQRRCRRSQQQTADPADSALPQSSSRGFQHAAAAQGQQHGFSAASSLQQAAAAMFYRVYPRVPWHMYFIRRFSILYACVLLRCSPASASFCTFTFCFGLFVLFRFCFQFSFVCMCMSLPLGPLHEP